MNPSMGGMGRVGSRVVWAVLAMIAIGCGGSPKSAPSSPGSAGGPLTPAPGDSGAPPAVASSVVPDATATAASTAPAGASAAPPPPAHPFASTAAEATSLIDDAITSRASELLQCVDTARARRKDPHARLVIEVGIDEEGHMLGVTLPKGEKHDKAFVDCVLAALRGAPFPQSHAGVITVRKTFEDKAVYR
jgi:hypothetical protein